MTIDKSVLVPLDVDQTFALITDPDRLRRWQAVSARIDLRAGGSYRWTITPAHTASGVVKEVEPGKRLVITWGWEGDKDLPPGASTVTITLEPAAGGTTVRLRHEGLDEDQTAGHNEGWTHYLERLAVAGRTGDAGADPWTLSPPDLDTITAAEAVLASCQLVLRGLNSTHATLSTPCSKFTVEELLEHLLTSISLLGGASGTPVVDTTGTPEHRVAVSSQSALESWRARGTGGTVTLGGNAMPAEAVVAILGIELLVHASDLARGTSQTVVVGDEVAAFVLGQAHNIISDALRDGDRFADAVATAPDADVMTKLLAYTGRSG